MLLIQCHSSVLLKRYRLWKATRFKDVEGADIQGRHENCPLLPPFRDVSVPPSFCQRINASFLKQKRTFWVDYGRQYVKRDTERSV